MPIELLKVKGNVVVFEQIPLEEVLWKEEIKGKRRRRRVFK